MEHAITSDRHHHATIHLEADAQAGEAHVGQRVADGLAACDVKGTVQRNHIAQLNFTTGDDDLLHTIRIAHTADRH